MGKGKGEKKVAGSRGKGLDLPRKMRSVPDPNCPDAEDALRKARALCRRLGPGWKPRVWENLGWHWSVLGFDGRLELCVYGSGLWWARLNSSVCDIRDLQVNLARARVGSAYAKTPKAAVAQCIKNAAADRDVLTRVLKAVGYE